MVFDTVSESVSLRDDKLLSLLPAATPGARTGRGSAYPETPYDGSCRPA